MLFLKHVVLLKTKKRRVAPHSRPSWRCTNPLLSMNSIENWGFGASPLWDSVWCSPGAFFSEQHGFRKIMLFNTFTITFHQNGSGLLLTRETTIKTGILTLTEFWWVPLQSLEWSSQSRPMTDLVRKSRLKTLWHAALFTGLQSRFDFVVFWKVLAKTLSASVWELDEKVWPPNAANMQACVCVWKGNHRRLRHNTSTSTKQKQLVSIS